MRRPNPNKKANATVRINILELREVAASAGDVDVGDEEIEDAIGGTNTISVTTSSISKGIILYFTTMFTLCWLVRSSSVLEGKR